MSNALTKDRKLDLLVAEKILGWQWVQAPKYDYYGPLPKQGKVLAPPTFDEDSFRWPPKGIVPKTFLVHHFSTDLISAQEVMRKMASLGFTGSLTTSKNPLQATYTYAASFLSKGAKGTHMGSSQAEVICRAALKAIQQRSKSK